MPSRQRIFATVALLLMLFGAGVTAQPTLPRQQAPAYPVRSVRSSIVSIHPIRRCALKRLASWGARRAEAGSAIPILLSMLGDDVTVPALQCEMSPWLRRTLPVSSDAQKWMATSPAKEAAEALGEIDDPGAIDELRAAANDSNNEVRRAVAHALSELGKRR